ncbi:MAG: phosphoadenylyl-sulfate reductase [Actinobacteria bacterium]|nr:phosphoadenylyl-sulfate reductase [Actinomycetota bacterium]
MAPVSGVPDLEELHRVSRALETRPATAAIEWAWDRFGDDLVLAASFQDCVMIDLVAKVSADIEIAFLDTGYHFAETLWYVEHVRRRYDLNLRVVSPNLPADDLWLTDTDACCAARKVAPLAKVLSGREAWMSGLRRADGPVRATTPVVTYDVGRGLVKVNPIALWSDLDVDGYVRDHDLPVHPLAGRGYASIGCWPCTRPVTEGDDTRAGRWAGTDKTECGLHA